MGKLARAIMAAFLFGALAVSGAAAQDTGTSDAPLAEPAAPLAEPDAPLAEPDTPVGEPATVPTQPAAPAAPAPTVPQAGDPAAGEVRLTLRATHGDWQVRCAPDNVECFMYQLAKDETGNPVAEINLVKLGGQSPAAAGFNVLTPLGTLLPPGLVLQIEGAEQRQYPFSWCDPAGCFARFAVDDTAVAAMKRGSAARMTLFAVQSPGEPVVLQVSLSGFTAAFDSLEAIPD
jgi:invasion protein IalB